MNEGLVETLVARGEFGPENGGGPHTPSMKAWSRDCIVQDHYEGSTRVDVFMI